MADLRTRYAELWAQRTRARASFRSGRSARLELERIFDEFGDLASGELVDRLTREHEAARFEAQREASRRLLRGVQARVLEARSLALEVELREQVRAVRLRVGKRERSAFAWLQAAAQLDAAQARSEVQRGLDRIDADLAPLRAEWRNQRAEALAKLGFDTPHAWAKALRPDVDLDAWAVAARELLSATQAAWHDALRAASSGAAPSGRVDLLRCAALPRWERAFSGATWDALDSLADAWHLRLRELRSVSIDEPALEGTDPEPFLAPLRVPGALAIVLVRRAPILDLRAALALGGRALALVFTSDALPVEQRLPADRALSLAWGELLAARLADPAWLSLGPLAARADAFAAQAQVLVLGELRSAAARTLTELDLAALPAGADPRALEDVHAARMQEALGCPWSGHSLLRECRAEPAAVDELRAACLAAQLAEKLRARHGRAFWSARACGDLLKELWHTGSTYSAEALARDLGLGPLSVELLTRPPR